MTWVDGWESGNEFNGAVLNARHTYHEFQNGFQRAASLLALSKRYGHCLNGHRFPVETNGRTNRQNDRTQSNLWNLFSASLLPHLVQRLWRLIQPTVANQHVEAWLFLRDIFECHKERKVVVPPLSIPRGQRSPQPKCAPSVYLLNHGDLVHRQKPILTDLSNDWYKSYHWPKPRSCLYLCSTLKLINQFFGVWRRLNLLKANFCQVHHRLWLFSVH